MGGGGGCVTYTIGYKYSVGMHMAACHGPNDKVLGVKVGEYLAWAGNAPIDPNAGSTPDVTFETGSSTVNFSSFLGLTYITLIALNNKLSLYPDNFGWGYGSIDNIYEGQTAASTMNYETGEEARWILEFSKGRFRLVFLFTGVWTSTAAYGAWVSVGVDDSSVVEWLTYKWEVESSEEDGLRLVYNRGEVDESIGGWVQWDFACPSGAELKNGLCYPEELEDGNRTIYINQPDMFGGESKEGGVVGYVDILYGGADQQPNDYLLEAIPKGAGPSPEASISSHPGNNYAIQVSGRYIRFGDHMYHGGVWGAWVKLESTGISKHPYNNYGLQVSGMDIRFGDVTGLWGDWVTVGESGTSKHPGNNYAINVDGMNIRFGGVGNYGPFVTFSEPTSYDVLPGIPAFRDVLSFVLRQVYVGTSKYIQPWSFLVQHCYHSDWQPATAPIGINIQNNTSLCFSIDCSGSMDYGEEHVPPAPGDPTRMDVVKVVLTQVMDYVSEQIALGLTGINIRIITWATPYNAWDGGQNRQVFTRNNATVSDIEEIKTFIDSMYADGGTDFRQGVYDVPGFFDSVNPRKNLFFFLTDGAPDSTAIAEEAAGIISDLLDRDSSPFKKVDGTSVDCYGINILHPDITYTSLLDNTPEDSVPVLGMESEDLLYVILRALGFRGYFDMNPAHIIRACLTNRKWGLGYPAGDVDDAAFTYAADLLYNEGLGLSLIWDQSTEIEDFITTILDHISGNLYIEPTTGKWVLKLIRQDYDAGTLPVFDGSVIESVENFSRRHLGELVNTVTIKYQQRRDTDFDEPGAALENLASGVGQMGIAGDVDSAVTLHNIGLINMMGGEIVNQELNFPGISRAEIANAVAARELANLSAELSACTLVMGRTAHTLRPGSVFKLSWPEYGITEEIMRVTEIDLGTLQDGRLRVSVMQEISGVGTAVYSAPSESMWTDPNTKPAISPYRYLIEAPYWHWVKRIGEGSAWDEVEDDEARLLVCAAKPTEDSLDYGLWTRIAPATYQNYGHDDFTPYAILEFAVGKTETVLTVRSAQNMGSAAIGGYAYLGDEIVAVEAIDGNDVQVVRAILDTIPHDHAAGTVLWFSQGWERSDLQQYFEADTVNAKVTPRTGRGELSVDLAPADSLVMGRRMDRPYPPGNLQINGEAFPEEIEGELVLTWAHRHRTQQTAYFVAQDEGDIGPEPGTYYELKIYNEDGYWLRTVQTTDNFYTYPLATEMADSFMDRPNTSLRFTLRSIREEV